jgi:FMN phosphatase YigB (HAD superfamily)
LSPPPGRPAPAAVTEIFRLAKKDGHPPEHWLHAGQSIITTDSGKMLGISPVWVNRPSPRPGAGAAKQASATPDVEVHSLAELVQLVAQPR